LQVCQARISSAARGAQGCADALGMLAEPGLQHHGIDRLAEALALARELAHNQIVPNILAWLALVAIAEGELEQASRYIRQSLADYARVFAGAGEGPMRDTQYRERPDFLETLIAAAHLLFQSYENSCIMAVTEQTTPGDAFYLWSPSLAGGQGHISNSRTADRTLAIADYFISA